MDYKQVFFKILSNTNQIALATSVDNIPNVRIVSFYHDVNRPEVIYFASDRKNQKVAEFKKNNRIAFTTIPREGIPHARSHNAIIQKSKFSIDEMKDAFIAKVPGYDRTIAAIGESLDVFEIHVQEAFVIVDFENAGPVNF
ncbi:MAG TPA: pyridoxamine 5'-phosphate oxidase family protein [Negativicutes bacterium]|nr:pyridoxamine 5'-phosphate oxidase family protein [Negativicutes bacterium]